jgi:hypothetical protein
MEPAARDLHEPHLSRLPLASRHRNAILRAHRAAMAAGHDGYVDPASGYFVMTAATLADRGICCDNGCRHCPYVT